QHQIEDWAGYRRVSEHTSITATDTRGSAARRSSGSDSGPLSRRDRVAPSRLSAAFCRGGPPLSGTDENLLQHPQMLRGRGAPRPTIPELPLATPHGRERPLDPQGPSRCSPRIVDWL